MNHTTPSWLESVIPNHILSIPTYVPGKPIAELERQLGIRGAVKMASNENPIGPSPAALRALEQHLPEANIYPESSAPELREALALVYGLSPDSIILGNGSDEIMQMSAHVFIRPGDEAIMGTNTFSMYRIVVEAFGGKAVRVPLKNYKFDLKAMASAVSDRTRLIFLAVPNSPTGTIVSRLGFETFLNDLPDGNFLLVLDEAYREYVQDTDCPMGIDYVGRRLPVLVLRTFSKIYGLAGLRVGYGLAEPWLIELINRVRPPFNINSLAQKAAVAALGDMGHVERSLQVTRQGMRYLQEELVELGLHVIPSQANFIAFCLENDARPVYEGLLKEGIIVRHLGSFGMDNCIRVTVGTDQENRKFVAALRKVLKG
ncbi:MAG: histidinol-phosphate transaminase [Desulfomonile sp.]